MRVSVRQKLVIVCALSTTLAVLYSARSAYADAAPKWSDAQLVGFSDVILRGRVTGLGVALDEFMPGAAPDAVTQRRSRVEG